MTALGRLIPRSPRDTRRRVPYQHSVWPTKRGARGFVGIGKIALTQARIDGLFNKSSPCSSRLYVPKPTPDGICKRPGLLYTEFGYFSRSKNRSTHHSEAGNDPPFDPRPPLRPLATSTGATTALIAGLGPRNGPR